MKANFQPQTPAQDQWKQLPSRYHLKINILLYVYYFQNLKIKTLPIKDSKVLEKISLMAKEKVDNFKEVHLKSVLQYGPKPTGLWS